jgi:hypothetical protein
MAKHGEDHLAAGLEAFRTNVAALKRLRGIENDSELWRMVKRKNNSNSPSRKTVNNAVQARHDAQISTLEAISETFDVPLWLALIPGLLDADLQSPNKEKLVALVMNYLACPENGRHHVESMAAAFAAKNTK